MSGAAARAGMLGPGAVFMALSFAVFLVRVFAAFP